MIDKAQDVPLLDRMHLRYSIQRDSVCLRHEPQQKNQIDKCEHHETYPVDYLSEFVSLIQIGGLRNHLFGFAEHVTIGRRILKRQTYR